MTLRTVQSAAWRRSSWATSDPGTVYIIDTFVYRDACLSSLHPSPVSRSLPRKAWVLFSSSFSASAPHPAPAHRDNLRCVAVQSPVESLDTVGSHVETQTSIVQGNARCDASTVAAAAGVRTAHGRSVCMCGCSSMLSTYNPSPLRAPLESTVSTTSTSSNNHVHPITLHSTRQQPLTIPFLLYALICRSHSLDIPCTLTSHSQRHAQAAPVSVSPSSAMSSPRSSGLVGVTFLPHGTMTLDPTRNDLPDGATSLHHHCMAISARIAALRPDLILLSTPHGLALHRSAAVYQPLIETVAQGSCEWKEQWTEYGVKVRLDGQRSGELLTFLQRRRREGEGEEEERVRAEGLTAFAGLSTPLRWGETVPLYFALHHLLSTSSSVPPPPSTAAAAAAAGPLRFLDASSAAFPGVVVLSQPRVGLTAEDRASFRIDQRKLLPRLGADLRHYLDSLPLRSLLVVSGDLAHTHRWSSDETVLPALYTPDKTAWTTFPQHGTTEADTYDEAVQRWMTGDGASARHESWVPDSDIICRQAGDVEEKGMSCGYTGLLTLQGVLGAEKVADVSSAATVESDWLMSDFCLMCPSYYGMASAMWTRRDKPAAS